MKYYNACMPSYFQIVYPELIVLLLYYLSAVLKEHFCIKRRELEEEVVLVGVFNMKAASS